MVVIEGSCCLFRLVITVHPLAECITDSYLNSEDCRRSINPLRQHETLPLGRAPVHCLEGLCLSIDRDLPAPLRQQQCQALRALWRLYSPALAVSMERHSSPSIIELDPCLATQPRNTSLPQRSQNCLIPRFSEGDVLLEIDRMEVGQVDSLPILTQLRDESLG